MKTTFDSIQTRESQYVLHTYRRQPVAFVRGKGPRLYDVDGREYLDFVSGIGVASLGHAHPGLAAAIADQATYDRPQQFAVGVSDVFVNGVQVLRDGEHTGATPGQTARLSRSPGAP